jgi:hypothetical protein
MIHHSLKQVNLAFEGGDDIKSPQAKGSRTTGDVMDIEVCDGRRHHLFRLVVYGMMDEPNINI